MEDWWLLVAPLIFLCSYKTNKPLLVRLAHPRTWCFVSTHSLYQTHDLVHCFCCESDRSEINKEIHCNAPCSVILPQVRRKRKSVPASCTMLSPPQLRRILCILLYIWRYTLFLGQIMKFLTILFASVFLLSSYFSFLSSASLFHFFFCSCIVSFSLFFFFCSLWLHGYHLFFSILFVGRWVHHITSLLYTQLLQT